MTESSFLEVKEIVKSFGGLMAIYKVSFNVSRGEIVAIIGPNGAGKTTLLNVFMGLLPFSRGEICFKGQKISGLPPHKIAYLGIARTFQDLRLFGHMLVVENVMIGAHRRGRVDMVSTGLYLPHAKREESKLFDIALEKLALVGLEGKTFSPVASLTAKEQKLLILARALALEPELLLIDETAAGLSVEEIGELAQILLKISDKGITIILVEHRMELVMSIAQRVIVLNFGRKIAEGSPAEIQGNKQVIAAYLGETPK